MGDHTRISISSPTKANDELPKFLHVDGLPHCPPADAAPIDAIFYAFHACNPPDPSDFQTADQRGAYKWLKDQCERRSNSMFADLEEIRQKVAELERRHGLVYQYISAGKVKKEHGLVKRTGRGSHHSLWISARFSMHAIFTEIK